MEFKVALPVVDMPVSDLMVFAKEEMSLRNVHQLPISAGQKGKRR